MEDSFREGYFPPDLLLGLETGWTLTEIRNLDPLTKRMYLKFLTLREEKEAKKIEDMKKDMEDKTSPTNREQVITFVDEEDFYSKVK